MSHPRASVILGAFNEEQLIGHAIGSVLAQTFEDFELIVVDDGSLDRTAEVVGAVAASDSRVNLVRHPQNKGFSAALNTGIDTADADYVAMIDADDLWMPTYLEAMISALDHHPRAGFAFTEAWWLDDASGRFFRRSTSEYLGAPDPIPDDPIDLLDSIIPSNWIFGLTTMRRSALEEVGGFDQSLSACEDYDLWIRMLGAGIPAVPVWEKLAIQRDRRGSMSTAQESMLSNLVRVLAPVSRDPALPEATRNLARHRLAELESGIEMLRGAHRTRAAATALRSTAGRARRRLAPGRVWFEDTPPEIAAAFPELG